MKKPDFLIIGTARGGTTSLFEYLKSEIFIKGPNDGKKEVHYFDLKFNNPTYWYFNKFDNNFPGLQFEATPDYLYVPEIPYRVKNVLGDDTKFIVLLRNPIFRTWSLYINYWSKRYGTSFDDLYRSMKTVNENTLEFKEIKSDLKHERLIHGGIYVRGIQRWMTVFPKKNFLILKSEDLFENPGREVKKCLKFLGWDDDPIYDEYQTFDLLNKPGKKTPKMTIKLKKDLGNYFRPFNKMLYEWIDFKWED